MMRESPQLYRNRPWKAIPGCAGEIRVPAERNRTEEARDRGSGEAWARELRARFVEITARRVEPAAVEDLVQDAMRIVLEKSAGGPARLDWCFQVLRNVIGNHYRRERTRRRHLVHDEARAAAVPVAGHGLESLAAEEAARLIQEGIEATGPPCDAYLAQLVAGASAASLADTERIEPAILYRRLYRCRQRLRQWLRDRGIAA